MSDRPPVVIHLKGPTPPAGREFCVTCAMLYLGEVSSDEATQRIAQHTVTQARQLGRREVSIKLPQSWRHLNLAVTTGLSVRYQDHPALAFPGPVCWIHLQGLRPEMQSANENVSTLIPGKASYDGEMGTDTSS